MNDADDYEALAAWEEAHPEENVGMWLWNASERLGRVEAIITDLAQQTEPTYVYVTVTGEEQERCALCDARLSLSPNPLAQHKESCEWRRAVDYRKDAEKSGADDGGAYYNGWMSH